MKTKSSDKDWMGPKISFKMDGCIKTYGYSRSGTQCVLNRAQYKTQLDFSLLYSISLCNKEYELSTW